METTKLGKLPLCSREILVKKLLKLLSVNDIGFGMSVQCKLFAESKQAATCPPATQW